ncbi:MAG TPA: DNA translocase FtsK 4TM domain-containing protein, partial [Acidimicrobiales bacterium]|nr:DNA translocase FtsK 4TM domain-containing protein [Acidimicrobiales bacterium]
MTTKTVNRGSVGARAPARGSAAAARGRPRGGNGGARPGGSQGRTSAPPRWRQSLASLVEDQSDDIWGLAFVLMGVLVALGVYADVIGPAGRAVRTGAADLFGWARYYLPVGLAALGGYLLWRHERPQPGRVAVGLGLALVALSGIAAVASGKPTLHQPLAAMGRGGGLVGALQAVPLQAGLGAWGAGLVLGVFLFLSVLIVTATPVRSVAAGARRALRATVHALRWLWASSIAAARRGARLASAARHPSVRGPGLERHPQAASSRGLVAAGRSAAPPATGDEDDQRAEFGWAALAADAGLPVAPRARRPRESVQSVGGTGSHEAPPAPPEREVDLRAEERSSLPVHGLAGTGKGEQLAIDLGVLRQPSPPWRLPPLALLRRSKQAEVDRRQVEQLGQTLEGALASHGVETRLVGATVGPSVTCYELELGPGVPVRKVTVLQRDIAYAMAAAEVR